MPLNASATDAASVEVAIDAMLQAELARSTELLNKVLSGELRVVVKEPLPSGGTPSAAGSSTEAPNPPRPSRFGRSTRAGAYCSKLEWFLLSGDAAMGASGTLAGVVSQIERGHVGGGGRLDAAGTYKHPYTDLQLGAGVHGIGEVELHRHLMAAWRMVRPTTQMRLCKRYTAPRATFRSDEGFGARDRYVEGSDGRIGQHNPTRTGTKSILEEYAGLAFELCDDPAQLLIACQEPKPVRKGKINKAETARRGAIIKEALRRANAADEEAHDEWFAAMAKVPGLRTFEQRTGRKRNQGTAGPTTGTKPALPERNFRRLLRNEADSWDAVGKAIASPAVAPLAAE